MNLFNMQTTIPSVRDYVNKAESERLTNKELIFDILSNPVYTFSRTYTLPPTFISLPRRVHIRE